MMKTFFVLALLALASPASADDNWHRARIMSPRQLCILDNIDRIEPINCNDPRAVARAEKEHPGRLKWLKENPPGADGCDAACERANAQEEK